MAIKISSPCKKCEVYRARDTRLDRIVAIKVSKIEFTEHFEREARAVAAINHPNICTLHDVGPNYLVMEYVETNHLAIKVDELVLARIESEGCQSIDTPLESYIGSAIGSQPGPR